MSPEGIFEEYIKDKSLNQLMDEDENIFIGRATGVQHIEALDGEKRIEGFKRYIHSNDIIIVIPQRRSE